MQLIFIINDYEDFFRDPINNGFYKWVPTNTLNNEWVDRQNLVFWWEKRWLSDGTTNEHPVFGSQQETFGQLTDAVAVLRSNYLGTYKGKAAFVAPTGVLQYVTKITKWRALTVEWVASSPVQLIYIIDDYEAFYRSPLTNGTYKYVDTAILTRNWVDRQDLIFWWKAKKYDNGSITEAPVYGSQEETFGALTDLNKLLRTNAP